MKKKINIGILFGGKSAEHEVSLQSAKNVLAALDREKYHPVLIGIDKTGRWHLNKNTDFLLNADNPKLIKLNASGDSIALIPQQQGKIAKVTGEAVSESVDVIFPILHGPFGEDGTIQGLLKLANVPFVGAGVLGSAVGMDKDVMKRLLRDADLPIGPFITLHVEDPLPDYESVSERLGIPFFVKPANMGSSVGISKVWHYNDYIKAMNSAFDYDNKVLIESFIEGREIECSVLGNRDPVASVPGEVISSHDFYSYDAKYIDENGALLKIPADISPVISKNIQDIAIKTFRTLCCEGLARVDFFLKENGDILINEINTMPGFTSISMYPRLWEVSGVSYTELIDRLIQLAFERFEKEQRLKTTHAIEENA